MNYAVEQRLRLIDFLLAHYGSIGRLELISYFGIEAAQATRDLALYNKTAPDNMLMNSSSKRWIKSDTFKCLYIY
jgi:hypothetical protein